MSRRQCQERKVPAFERPHGPRECILDASFQPAFCAAPHTRTLRLIGTERIPSPSTYIYNTSSVIFWLYPSSECVVRCFPKSIAIRLCSVVPVQVQKTSEIEHWAGSCVRWVNRNRDSGSRSLLPQVCATRVLHWNEGKTRDHEASGGRWSTCGMKDSRSTEKRVRREIGTKNPYE